MGWARLRGCYQWGAQLQGEEGGIAYHYFYRCKFLNTLVGHPAVRYKGEGNGFRTNGNVKHLVLEECEMSGNGRLGVQLGGPGVDALRFVRCVLKGNQGAAVAGPGTYSRLEWVNCVVEGNARNDLPPAKPFAGPWPVAAIEAPAEARVGQPVSFRGRPPHPATALWDLGDGPPAIGDPVEHTYDRSGTYRVTLVVWDAAGRGARAERSIRIIEADGTSSTHLCGRVSHERGRVPGRARVRGQGAS